MNWSFSKKIIIISSILIIVLSVVYVLIFTKIREYNQNIAYLENEMFLQTDKQQKMSLMDSVIQENREYIDLIENSVIPKSGDVAFIETIESLASRNNLTMTIQALSFENSDVLESKGMVFFKIRAVAKGSWSNIYTFLALIESLPISLKIENLALINSSSESGGGTGSEWQINFDMKVLKYK